MLTQTDVDGIELDHKMPTMFIVDLETNILALGLFLFLKLRLNLVQLDSMNAGRALYWAPKAGILTLNPCYPKFVPS